MGGAIGVVYGFCFLQAPKLLPILMAVHVALALVLTPHLGSLAVDWAQVASNAAGVDVIGCLFAILVGYVLFVRFVRKQGLRYFRVQTEIELAEQIHRSLVPAIARHTSQHEFYGVSAPSGEMGGDLVDVVQDSNKRIAYLADVSGHGVPSGVLMAMVKSAVRMRLGASCEPQVLLEDLNRVISDLMAAEMFVTVAFVSLEKSNDHHDLTAFPPRTPPRSEWAPPRCCERLRPPRPYHWRCAALLCRRRVRSREGPPLSVAPTE